MDLVKYQVFINGMIIVYLLYDLLMISRYKKTKKSEKVQSENENEQEHKEHSNKS